jgi:membrane protein DedA with SNARE-associated domain
MAAWLHQLTTATRGETILDGHGVRGGKAMIETLRRRLIAVPARLVRHAGQLTLRLPPGHDLLAEVLARMRAFPAMSGPPGRNGPASQGKLGLAAVIVVSVVAGEAGGLGGYAIGRRWGRRLLDRPGRHQAGREKLIERGQRLYTRWGWLAVFFTPAVVSGTAKMPPYRFAFWNLLDSLGWTVSVAASSYGIGRLATGHHTWHDAAILIIGLGATALGIVVAVRRHRKHEPRRPAAATKGPSGNAS